MKESWSTFAKVLVTVGLSVRHDLKFCKEKKKKEAKQLEDKVQRVQTN